jgi:hypothetical protein
VVLRAGSSSPGSVLPSVFFKCYWCPCVFCSVSDLELHLRFFGDKDHSESWRVMHWKVGRRWRRILFPCGDVF